MPKTFAEYSAERERSRSPEEATAVRVFDAAYALGASLAGARRAQGLTQAELAVRSGVTQADISRIERAQQTPTTPTLLKLIEAMGGRLDVVVPRARGRVSTREALVGLNLV